jgi:hypothetical protein
MKVAFHFNADLISTNERYSDIILKTVFKVLLNKRNLKINSKIYIGDILLTSFAYVEKHDNKQGTVTQKFNQDKYCNLLDRWWAHNSNNWRVFTDKALDTLIYSNTFAVCFETLETENAKYLADHLKSYDPFLGGFNGRKVTHLNAK